MSLRSWRKLLGGGGGGGGGGKCGAPFFAPRPLRPSFSRSPLLLSAPTEPPSSSGRRGLAVLCRRAGELRRSAFGGLRRRGPGIARTAIGLRGVGTASTEDEYGEMRVDGETFKMDEFTLESGVKLKSPQVRYKTFGKLNEKADNCIVVCHALTGNASVDDWWSTLLGDGKLFDTSKYFVFCANILGSCYGSTGPSSTNPETNERYGLGFPMVTIRDSVRAHKLVLESLGVKKIQFVLGGSLGGMQSLEWALIGKELVSKIVVIACGARHTAWQIAISEVQRASIMRDPSWENGKGQALKGLGLARQIAMISYRSHNAYDQKFGRHLAKEMAAEVGTSDSNAAIKQGITPRFNVESYLHYQDQKFLSRFDAASYIRCTQKMDTHDVGRDRGGVEAALASLTQPALIIGFDGDLLYPLKEQEELARLLPNATLREVSSDAGHDAFLLEYEEIQNACADFLA